MKQALLIPVVAFMIVGGTLIAVMPARASTTAPQRSVLVQKLSQRFGLQETEVELVMQEVRQEHQQEMQQRLEARLDQAIKNGNLTEVQKQAILAKHQELLAKWEAGREQFQNMTPEERREAREQARVELEAWAQENGIDMKFFMIMHKGMGKLHRGE